MTADTAPPTALQVGQRLGWCERPIQLRADRETVEVASGDVIRRERTDHYVTCKTRRRADCEPCSRLYAGDAYHLLHAGLAGGKGVSIDVRRSTAVMATLTAPGRDTFGVGHHFRDKHGTRRCHPGPTSRRCHHGRRLTCGRRHAEDDHQLGAPLCDDCFDHHAAVAWNAALPELWRRFTVYLRRYVETHGVDVQYARTVEPQQRGLMHVHAIIRFDTDGGTALHPAVARAAIQRAAAAISTPDGHRFGRQVDVRTISGSDAGAALDRRRAAGYLAKYATGSAVDVHAKHAGPTPHLRRLQHIAARRLLPAEIRKIRRHCPTVGLSDQEQTLAEDRARRRARELGFTGHYLTKSRRFSTTFTVLRDARRTHAESFAPTPHTTSSATTTDVVWTYLGRGYRFEHRSIAVAVRWLTSHHPEPTRLAA